MDNVLCALGSGVPRRAPCRPDGASLCETIRTALSALAIVLLFSLAGCGGGGGGGSSGSPAPSIPTSGPGDVDNLFPLAVDDRWVYNVTVSETGQGTSSRFLTARITAQKSIGGYTTLVMTYAAQGFSGEEYYYKNGAGTFFFGDNSGDPVIAAIVPYELLAFPVQANASFVQVDKAGINFGDDLDGDGRNETIAIRSQVKVIGFEPVTVAVGSFANCARLQTDITETVTLSRTGLKLTLTGVVTEWYAPGIGLVKRSSQFSATGYASTRDDELVAYNIGGQASDTTPPAVTSVTPAANAPLLTAAIQAEFSEPIDPATLDATTFTLRDPAGQPVGGAVASLGKTATFTPSAPLLASGIYSATLTTGIRDVAGNALAADYAWSFVVDHIAPTIVSTSPVNNATNVPFSASISVTFSEEMDPTSIGPPFFAFTVSGPYGTVAGSWTYSNKTATFIPLELDRNALYTATVTTGARDLAGNHLAGNYSWSFTTDRGLFQDYVAFPTGSHPEAVAIGDVNGDGRNDVVMTTSYYFDTTNDFKLFVFLQNADGTLAAPIKYPTGSSYGCMAQTVAIGDVNHDGRNDVVIGNSSCGIEVFLQDGTGALSAGVPYPSVDSHKIRIADLNNDGLPDVVGIGWGTDSVSVWLQSASGTLDSPVTYPVTHSGYDDLEVGDVNDDGLIDIVVMSGQLYATPNLGVLTQKAGGGFNAPAYYSVGPGLLTAAVAVGDVNGDGLNDVVVTYPGNSPSSRIGVFSQNNLGTLDAVVSYPSYDSPSMVEIADVTGDGRKDIVVVHAGWLKLGIYKQLPGGTIEAEERYPAPYGSTNPHALAVGDINGDGRNDVVTTDFGLGLVVFYHW